MKQDKGWVGRRGSGVGVACVAAGWAMMAPAAVAQEQTIAFDLPSQPLSSALLEFGRQARMSVLAPRGLVEGKVSPAIRDQLTARAALEQMLEGSGLVFEFVAPDAVRVSRMEDANISPERRAAERVIVTGTNIRGVHPDSSPVEVYTAADLEATGAVTTEQFVSKLPQNLGTLSIQGAGAQASQRNTDSVAAVDLRGLGVGTTLTLVNGHRMARSSSGRASDVSLIPAAAIARVEVLTDGASAIYGADAIGGVINFVLRDDFEGAETRMSFGGVSRGGFRQGEASQTVGANWSGGHGLATYAFNASSALEIPDRDYAAAAGIGYLTPIENRHNILIAGSQDLTDRLTLDLDAGFARRDVKNEYAYTTTPPVNHSHTVYNSTTDQTFADLALNYRVSDWLSADFSVSYSDVKVDAQQSIFFFRRTPVPAPTLVDYGTHHALLDVMAKANASLFDLPGGQVKASFGGGLLTEDYRGINLNSLAQSAGRLGRKSPYAFGEVFAPLIGPDQAIPLIRRLEVTLAARYSDYQDDSRPSLDRDFGNSTDPKIGVLWSPASTLNVRGTYGTSFRAPSLMEIDPTGGFNQLSEATIAGVPATGLTLSSFAMKDLRPETAKTYTVGFDYRSQMLKGFRLSASYYNIDYKDRIGIAPTGGLSLTANPLLLPDKIYRAPSAAFIEEQLRASNNVRTVRGIDFSNPMVAAAAIYALPNNWIVDNRYRNLATSRQDGFDLAISQQVETGWGDLTFGVNATHILAYKQQGSPASAVLTAVNIPGQPADWRGRAHTTYVHGPVRASIGINYAGSYENPWTTGSPPVDSWTTTDLSLSYDFAKAGNDDTGWRLSLSIQNLFDEDPPYLDRGSGTDLINPVGFDPANANPLGRLATIAVVATW